jgi:peptidyl-tRNA hydrolase, PTH1 family
MKMLIGLGNPGPQYTKTRHNVGFMVIDRLIAAHAANVPVKGRFQAATVEAAFKSPNGDEKVIFMKPTTFMNLSGRAVGEAARFFKLDVAQDILVITDDFYLPTGSIRMKPAGGTAGHNGLTNIQEVLGTDTYPRLRVGVGLQPSGGKPPLMDQADFVLSRFTADEETLLDGAIKKASDACEAFIKLPLDKAMNKANAGVQRPNRPKPTPDPESN